LEADVYLKGVAEDQPLHVFYRSPTSIPERFRRAIRADVWHDEEIQKMTVKAAERRGEYWLHNMELEPSDRGKIRMEVNYPRYRNGRRVKGVWGRPWFKDFEYVMDGTRPILRIHWSGVMDYFAGLPPNAEIKIEIGYPVAPAIDYAAVSTQDNDADADDSRGDLIT
jgi:hypothetical protein